MPPPMSSKKTDCSFARISVQRSTYTYSSLPSRTWFPCVPRESYSGTAGGQLSSVPACLRPSFSASGGEGRRGLSHLPGDGDGTLGLRGRGRNNNGHQGAEARDIKKKERIVHGKAAERQMCGSWWLNPVRHRWRQVARFRGTNRGGSLPLNLQLPHKIRLDPSYPEQM
ncbi:unnamed protein product [Arctogadus glacialis]